MIREPSALVLTTLLVLSGLGAHAQDAAKEKFAQAQKQNGAQLRQYSWMSRTELKLKGDSKNIKMESVRYEASGELQKPPMDNPTLPPQNSGAQQRGGRLKQKVVEKKKEEYIDPLGGLAKLAQAYAHLTPEQTQAFAQGATISRAQTGAVEIQGINVVVKGDSVTVQVDPSTFLIRQATVDSPYEQNPLKVTVNYQVIPQGPSYPAKVDLSDRARDVGRGHDSKR